MKAGKADCIFFRGEKSRSACGSSLSSEVIEIARCVAVMVWEYAVAGNMQPGDGEACEELEGTRDAAEGHY